MTCPILYQWHGICLFGVSYSQFEIITLPDLFFTTNGELQCERITKQDRKEYFGRIFEFQTCCANTASLNEATTTITSTRKRGTKKINSI